MVIFVYGTLKKGYNNSPILDNQEYLGVVCTKESRFFLYEIAGNYRFPALVERESGLRIFGELYNVSDSCLATLDRIENVENKMYARKERTVLDSENTEIQSICLKAVV